MLKQIYHKQNELFETEFFKDKECTEIMADFCGYENIYIELKNGDISPITAMPYDILPNFLQDSNIYIPYIPSCQKPCPDSVPTPCLDSVITLDDITLNLSKYIPKEIGRAHV